MRLYFTPNVCSLSPHIALVESGLDYEIEKVDLRAKLLKDGQDYRRINPKGAVPALQLDSGEILTEGAAIVQYIADQTPESKLAPPAGTLARYRLQEWLSYIGTELHKSFGPFFSPLATEDMKKIAMAALLPKLGYVAGQLEGKPYLMGENFTVADGYLYTVLTWAKLIKIDLSQWPALTTYFDRIDARPSVQAARAAESAS